MSGKQTKRQKEEKKAKKNERKKEAILVAVILPGPVFVHMPQRCSQGWGVCASWYCMIGGGGGKIYYRVKTVGGKISIAWQLLYADCWGQKIWWGKGYCGRDELRMKRIERLEVLVNTVGLGLLAGKNINNKWFFTGAEEKYDSWEG